MTNLEIDKAYVGGDQVEKIYLGEELIYSGGTTPVDYRSMPLTIEALSGGTLQLTNNTSQTNIYYNLNDDIWQLIDTDNMSFNLQAGDIIQFGATEVGNLGQYSAGKNLFYGNTLAFKVYGNIESLEYGKDNFINQDTSVYLASAFTTCFSGCSGLTDASNLVLPATTLASYCYQGMFSGCTSLTTAPELPATTLTGSCYANMFWDCTSLTSAPVLPATTLATSCYKQMFRNCTNLTQAPALPATSLTSSCYQYMFQGCTSLTTAPVLPATTLASSCYSGMFAGCTSLTTAPELPATALTTGCYQYLFNGCTNLNYIKCLVAKPPSQAQANSTLNYWVSGVSATGVFVKNPSASWSRSNVRGVPTNWTILDAHPGEVWFEQSGGSGYSGYTSDNESYGWTSPGPGEEWVPSNNQFWIVDDGHLVKADYQACGYEYDCDGVGIIGGEGGWDDDNQEWKLCKSVTGATAFTISYKIYEIVYTRASGNTPASVYIATQSDPLCEDCGLCTDEFGNCVECDPGTL